MLKCAQSKYCKKQDIPVLGPILHVMHKISLVRYYRDAE